MIKKPQKINRIIPFARPNIDHKEINAAIQVLKNGWLTMGPTVLKFEKEFSKFVGIKNSVAVSSATAGLHLALLACGIGPKDEVILPSYTFAACANTIVNTGARPVFAEVQEDDFLLDPNDVRKKITKKTKAIMIVHFGGQMAQMEPLIKIAQKNRLKVIEDCAHSPGAKYRGKMAGTFGDLGVFSFYAIKNMTTGEGGMVVTPSKTMADKMRMLRLHGMSLTAFDRYSSRGTWHYDINAAGFKYNLTDVSAAIGLEQLKKINQFNLRRAKIAELYQKYLGDEKELILPVELAQRKHVWHLYPIRVKAPIRGMIINKLKEFNISTSVHFIPLHLQPFYRREFNYKKGDLPLTEKIFAEEISLPMYPSLKNSEVKYISTVLKYLSSRKL